jgi:hypothetical protein
VNNDNPAKSCWANLLFLREFCVEFDRAEEFDRGENENWGLFWPSCSALAVFNL